jgi:hypothetical protein
MKIPDFVVAAIVTVILGLQAWALVEIVNLKVDVAAIKATLGLHSGQADKLYQSQSEKYQ